MDPTLSIENEIELLWQVVAAQAGIESPYDANFGHFLDETGVESQKIAQASLQPWLSILEQEISWLGVLHLALTDAMDSTARHLQAIWALTGAACAQAVAIRKLCLIGVDGPAKAILRSLIETLDVCTAITYDAQLRQRFKEAVGFDDAKQLWRDEFTEKKMRKRLQQVYQTAALEPDVLTRVRDWLEEELTMGSQAVHPSYTAATFSARPMSFDPHRFPVGVFGECTPFSIRTLDQATKVIWLYATLGFNGLIEPDTATGLPLYVPNDKNLKDRHVNGGRGVITALVLRHWTEAGDMTSNPPYSGRAGTTP